MKVRTKLFVRAPDGSGAGAIKKYISCSIVPRDSDVGSWSVSGIPLGPLLDMAEPGSALVVERDGKELMAGPFDVDERVWSNSADTITLSGYSDEIALFDEIAYPCAQVGSTGAIFPTAGYDVRTGPAETVMKQYVYNNLVTGGAFSAGRTRPLTIAADTGAGTTVTGRARFDIIGELLQGLAIAGGDLGFRIRESEFDVYPHVDRSDSVVFSRSLRNLYGLKLKRKAPTLTHPMVAGGGELTTRVFVAGGDPVAATTWNRRIAELRDRRDTSNLGELAQTAAEEIFKGQETYEATLYPRDTNRAQFGIAYDLGDTVTVEEQRVVMRQAKITLDENGEIVEPQPSITGFNADALLQVFDSQRELQRQLYAIQRSQ